ncbi:MAG: hypothetical protein FD126_3020 [Elusimicrobia bacterium]|nr:MAG: hypothetical protein FD126_3020 [Elusimicrobiota bacterium]
MSEDALRELYARTTGKPPESVDALKADGSARRLFRLRGKGASVIGAVGPDPRENKAFLSFSRHFRAQKMNVPEIFAEDLAKNVYLEEDLGDATLFQYLTANRVGGRIAPEVLRIYRKVVTVLPRFQTDAAAGLDYSACYPRASFDRQSMLWDLNHFKYYFLRLSGIPFDEQALEDDFAKFADFLLEAPRDHFLYRDFQSRNVMVRDGEPWFIDYQGGRKGAMQYDIASMLYDAKADLPFALREELLATYLDAACERVKLDRADFLARFPGFVLVRIMQAMGTYGLRGFYERKTHFLQSIPYAVRNLERLLQTYELPVRLPALSEVWRRLVGVPADEKGHGGGFIFDCRGLPNPGREARFAPQTGRDKEVADFLGGDPSVRAFLEKTAELVTNSIQNYRTRNFTDLFVAYGCTGGQHRSVYCAESLARLLRAQGVAVELSHRELDKPK